MAAHNDHYTPPRITRYAWAGGIVIATASVLLNVVQISEWATTSNPPQISASGVRCSPAIPPSVRQLIQSSTTNSSTDPTLSKLLAQNSTNEGDAIESDVITIDLQNTGDLPAREVRIELPGTGVAVIEKRGAPAKELNFTDEIQLGTLENARTLRITIWRLQAGERTLNPMVFFRGGQAQVAFENNNTGLLALL